MKTVIREHCSAMAVKAICSVSTTAWLVFHHKHPQLLFRDISWLTILS